MVLILNGIRYTKAQPIGIQTDGCHFDKKYLKFRLKWPFFNWVGLPMLANLKSDLQKVEVSDPLCFMVQL